MSLLPLLPFLTLIKERTGLALETPTCHEKLQLGIHERIKAQNLSSSEHYLDQLTRDVHEFQTLINHVTINETYFFREAIQLDFLVHTLVPRLLTNRRTHQPIRILSAGCSSGEEPYSIMMALYAVYGEQTTRLFQVMGGDIDSHVLAKAREGIYNAFSFRGVDNNIQSRYFVPHHHQFLLKPEIREQVKFYELNLFQAAQHPDLQQCDIIFFRNVSIYFDQPERLQIQRNLAALLKTQGILMVGITEIIGNDLGVLPLIEDKGMFYLIKSDPVHKPIYEYTPPVIEPPKVIQPPQPLTLLNNTPINLEQLQHIIQDGCYEQALNTANAMLTTEPFHQALRLLKAYVLLNQKHWAEAEMLAEHILNEDHWNLDALMIMGLSAKWQQQWQSAQDVFKKIIYAQNQCWLAHYYLAECYKSDVSQAIRQYKTVLQILNQIESSNCPSVLPRSLPEAQARFLCEHHIKKLSASMGEH